MSFNIKNSFVSRAVVEDDKQVDTGKEEEVVVIQEQYDPRTLFERLQEQKTLKEEKFAEESRLSNQIKRVDEEEAEFFRILSDEKEKLEYERKIKEKLELEEYRLAVEARSTPAAPPPVAPIAAVNKPVIKSNNNANKSKVKGALFIKKKKRSNDDSSDEEEKDKAVTKKPKTSMSLLSDTYGDISSSDSDSS